MAAYAAWDAGWRQLSKISVPRLTLLHRPRDRARSLVPASVPLPPTLVVSA
jgi:hypothetical protein